MADLKALIKQGEGISHDEVENGIKAVAMDMGLAFQKSVRDCLPNADIVFDRFHVMKNYSQAIQNQRRVEFCFCHPKGSQGTG